MDEQRPSRESLPEVKDEAGARRRERQVHPVGARGNRTPRYRDLRLLIGGAAVMAVVAAGALWISGRTGSTDAAPDRPSSSPAARPAPSQSPPPSAGDVFSGTPAQTWSIGKAGISIPPVKTSDRYLRDAAPSMRRFAKKYLIATMLDTRVVIGDEVKPFLDILEPGQATDLVAGLRRQATADRGNVPAWDAYLNRFRPEDWTLVAEPRVKGSTAVLFNSDNCVVFSGRYAVAYALAPRIGGDPRLVVVRRDPVITICTALFVPKPGYVVLSPSGYTSSASVCGADWPHTGYVAAWVDREQAARMYPVPPGSETWDPTALDRNFPKGCFQDTSGF